MPYKLGSRRLALDVAWEHNGVQYPANWLRLSTAQDRAELGHYLGRRFTHLQPEVVLGQRSQTTT